MDSSTQNTQNRVSYARITQQMQFPTREQAIVLDAVDGLSVHQYTVAIGKLIDPKNIRFVSRISHGRVCLYLSSKELVDKLTDNPTKVNIDTHRIEIRPLMSKAKRIIISNVCPIIPHQFILDELIKYNVKPASQITFIRAGMSDPGYSHILSFRRQIYIQPEDVSKIPETMKINYNNTVYWIYFSAEKLTCFLCKEEGHLAKFCKNFEETTQSASIDSVATQVNSSQNNIDNIDINTISTESEELEVNNKDRDTMPPPSRTKRVRSNTTSTTSTAKEPSPKHNDPSHHKIVQSPKKPRKLPRTDISLEEVITQAQSVQEIVDKNEQNFPLDYKTFTEFLHSTYGKSNILDIAKTYTNDIPALIKMLAQLIEYIEDRKLKSRIKRLRKRMEHTECETTTSEDENSICEEEL